MGFGIILQPPYSPELNLVEKLWQYIKDHTIKNRTYDNLKDLEDKICEFVKNNLNPEIIRSVCNVKYVQLYLIIGIRSDKCSDSEIEQLLEVFTRAIGYFTSDLPEKYWENLNDFFDSDKSEISNFSLKIQKKPKGSVFQYIGEFKTDNKNLKIYAKSSN